MHGQDKLVNKPRAIHTETDDKSKEKLAELSKEILFNKGFVQNVAQMLLSFDDPNM
jgi:hypothetical protein